MHNCCMFSIVPSVNFEMPCNVHCYSIVVLMLKCNVVRVVQRILKICPFVGGK